MAVSVILLVIATKRQLLVTSTATLRALLSIVFVHRVWQVWHRGLKNPKKAKAVAYTVGLNGCLSRSDSDSIV